MADDRTPRTISLTSLEDGDEEPKARPSKRRKDRGAETPSAKRAIDRREGKEPEHVEMDPRDRARMTAR